MEVPGGRRGAHHRQSEVRGEGPVLETGVQSPLAGGEPVREASRRQVARELCIVRKSLGS